VLDKGEVFDSSLLKDTVNSLIAEGKRNFAIDLSPLDYIYSDAINVILAINRRILDVSGRLSLLSPISEVRSILERAGLHNILKIYDSEADLLKSSEDIILQTTRFNLSELKSYQEPKPKNEFEDFRSQIGAAMTEGPTESSGSYGTESFESEITDDAFAVRQPPRRSPAPHFEEPFIPPPPPPPQQRQAARPFEQSQAPIPRRPASMQQQSFPVEQDSFEFQTPSSEFPRGKSRPAPAQAAASRRQDRDYDRFESDDDDFDDDMPKRSMAPVIIGAIVLVILGIGGYMGYTSFSKKEPKQNSLSTLSSTPSSPANPTVQTPLPSSAPSAPSVEPSAPPPTPPPKVVSPAAPAPIAAAVQPAAEKETPKPSGSWRKPSGKTQYASPKSGKSSERSSDKISISSRPAGATVSLDGRVIGTTPFKWSDPPQGTLMLIITKNGYNDATKTIDYAGGNKSEFVALSRIPKEVSTPSASVEPPPAEEAAPAPTPPQNEEPAPEPSPPPSASSSSSGGGGENATIFISSMPPVADVYMDGKLIGKTNISKLNVTAGSHTMKYVKGAIEITEDMTFKPGDNPSHLVILKR
jgi:anti-anti-sigma factor